MAATPGRFEVEDGEIIDTKARQIISLDQLAKLATPEEQDSIRQQIQDSGWAGADQTESSDSPALARGTVSRPSVTNTPSQQDALPSRPSLQQFMEVAKQDNPDVPDKDLRRYWAQNYSDINPKTLPTLESFLPAAKEDNPGVSDQALKAYWEENYGDLGAAEKEAGDFGRGVSTAFKQIPQLGYGVAAGIGAAGESMLGEGGISTKLKEWGVAGYLEKSKEIYAQSKPSDDFTYSWDQAKQGNFGALVDWMQYGMGYMGAQGAQMLATAGAGSVAGRLAQGPVSSMAAGLVAKEAARLKATQSGATLAAEELAKVATANVASRIGQTTALAAAATGMEGGEIFGDLSAESVKSGQPLSGEQLAKAFGATLAAGSLEFVGDKLGIDLMLGKTLAGKMGGRAARMGTSAAAGAAVEGGTEVGQTLIEEYGKGRDAFSPEAMREAVNAGALGALGGTVYGGAGGIVARKDEPPASIPVESIPDQIGVGDPTVSIDQAIANAQDILSAPVSSTRPQEDALSSRLAKLSASTAAQREADRLESERQLQSGERLPSAQESAMQTDGIPRTGQDIPILEGPQSSPSTLPIADPSRLWMDEAVVPGIEPGQAFTPRASSEPDAKARLQAERERLLSMRKTPSAPSDMAQPVMSETPAPSDIPLQSAADLAYPSSERGRMPTQEELALRDRGPEKRAAQQVPLIEGGEGDATSTIIPGATFSPRQEPVLTPKERLAAEREKLVRMKATRPAPMPSEPTVPPSSTTSDAPLRSAVDRAYPSVSELHDLARDKGFDVESPVFKTLTKMSTGKTHLDELSPSARDRFAETLKKLTPRETPTIVESPTKKALAPVQPGSPSSDAVTAPRSALPPEQNAEMLLRAEKANADLESSSEMQDESLIDFLKSKGGLQDQGGELSTMEVDAQRKAFSKKLIQEKGLTLDQAAELAHEAGYIQDRDIALLLDGIDKEVRGKGQHANWYRELTTGPKPMTREAIDTAVGKIIEDHGVDTGAAVERVKAALLNDGEFDGTQWGEDAAAIARGDWPAWIPKPDALPQHGATPQQEPVSASPSTKGTTTTPPQSEAATVPAEEPFSLTQQTARADKPKPKATQLSIDVPPPTIGERPVIGREVTPEEAPLFSESAKQPDSQQLDIAQEPEPVAPNAAPEVAPSPTEILASALRTAADQIEGKKAEAKIEDVGEKIGGARKDIAEKTGAKAKVQTPKDETPGWRKRFTIQQVVGSRNPSEVGKWAIHDSKKTDFAGRPRQVGNHLFDSKEEAEAAIPMYAVAMKHRVRWERDGQYAIYRNISDRKVIKVVDQTFPTEDDAKRYMIQHAEEIIELRTNFGEEILPRPDTVTRAGPDYRNGRNVTADDFRQSFDFRAVEFGNWNNQVERQEVMNHAYDGLMDLADTLNIPPKAIGLNGDLALAFGARGQGLSSAVAHYERTYGVINLTKMSGAGHLAHEWMHAADHYFGRQDTKASSEKVANERGDLVFDTNGISDYASHGFRAAGSKVREEVRQAYTNLMKSMFKKGEQFVEDATKAQKFVGEARQEVANKLKQIRDDLGRKHDWMKRNGNPATSEQLAEFDAIAQRILDGELFEDKWVNAGATKTRRMMMSGRWSNEAVEKVSAIYKAVRNRSGFDSQNQSGSMDRLRMSMKYYSSRLKMLADAQQGTEKTKTVPTSYAMEAKAMDEGRRENYWMTEHEMLARAFAAYVEDTLKAKGRKSDFITYQTFGSVPTTWGWKKPYPEGQERKDINAAFQKFFDLLKTKETEKGTALFSRSMDDERPPSASVGSPSQESLDKISRLNATMEAAEGVSNAFRFSRNADHGVIDAYQAAFGVDVVPITPATERAAGYNGVHYQGTLFVNTDANHGIVQIAGHELLHQLRRDQPELYDWFADNASRYFKPGALRNYGRRLQKAGANLEQTDVREELLADVTGDALADPAFLRQLAADNPGRFQQFLKSVLDWMREVISNLSKSDFSSSHYVTDMEALRGYLAEVLKAYRADGQDGIATAERPVFSKSKDQTKTKAFKAWFGKSKVVDSNGKPLVVYHGTKADFDTFNTGQPGYDSTIFGSYEVKRSALFFAEDPGLASEFATQGEQPIGSNVKPVFLAIKNPVDIREGWDALPDKFFDEIEKRGFNPRSLYRRYNNAAWEAFNDNEGGKELVDILKQMGYDGARLTESLSDEESEKGYAQRAWAAFDPNQIKSATGNKGTFDPNNPSIAFSRAMRSDDIGLTYDQLNNPHFSGLPTAQQQAALEYHLPPLTKMDAVIRTVQDKNIDMVRLVDAIKSAGREVADDLNPVLKEELYMGRVSTYTQSFLSDELRPLIDAMRLNKVTLPQLDEYLHARHAKEANAHLKAINPDREDNEALSGMTDAEADRILAAADKPKMDRLAAKVDDILRKTRQLLVDYGLESQATVDGWASDYQHYVPLHRAGFEDGKPGTGQGRSVRGAHSKSRTGSNLTVTNILANVAMDRERAIVRGEKMRPVIALAGLLQQNPNKDIATLAKPASITYTNPETGLQETAAGDIGEYRVPRIKGINKKTGMVEWRPDPLYKGRDNVINFRINGADHAIIFNEENDRAVEMAKSLKDLDVGRLNGVLAAIAPATRYLSSISTQYNPVFGVVNFVRDIQFAMLSLSSTPLADKRAEVFKGTFRALRGIYADARAERKGERVNSEMSKLWERFQKVGGPTGYREMFRGSNDRAKAIEHMLDQDWWQKTLGGKILTANGHLSGMQSLILNKAAKPLFEWLSDYNQTMENAVRLATFKAGLDSGMTDEQAASTAKNLTVNFNKKGAVTTQVGAMYAFFNASVQGTARIADTLFEKGRFGYLSATGKKIVAGGIALGSLQALGLMLAGFGEDEPPEFVRARSLILPMPGTDKGYLAIPMPLGFNILPNFGRLVTESLIHGKPMDRAYTFMANLVDTFSPVGGAGSVSQFLAPSVADPLVALSENKDWAGRKISKEDFNAMKPTPGHTRAKDSSTPWARGLSEMINYATGGTNYVPGKFSPTPDAIDYLIGSLTGGVGRELAHTAQSVTGLTTGEDVPLHKVPLVGRFVGDAAGPSAVRNDFYENLSDVHQAYEEVHGRLLHREDATDFLADHPEARLEKMATHLQREISQMTKRKREMVAKGESRERVRLLEMQISSRMQRFNDRVRELQDTR